MFVDVSSRPRFGPVKCEENSLGVKDTVGLAARYPCHTEWLSFWQSGLANKRASTYGLCPTCHENVNVSGSEYITI